MQAKKVLGGEYHGLFPTILTQTQNHDHVSEHQHSKDQQTHPRSRHSGGRQRGTSKLLFVRDTVRDGVIPSMRPATTPETTLLSVISFSCVYFTRVGHKNLKIIMIFTWFCTNDKCTPRLSSSYDLPRVYRAKPDYCYPLLLLLFILEITVISHSSRAKSQTFDGGANEYRRRRQTTEASTGKYQHQRVSQRLFYISTALYNANNCSHRQDPFPRKTCMMFLHKRDAAQHCGSARTQNHPPDQQEN